MQVFYHQAAEAGLNDFAKTVFQRVPISVVEEALADHPQRDEITSGLRETFPDGTFNCWGTPSESGRVGIRNLEPGDAVILAGRATQDGTVPALAIVRKFWDYRLEPLSQAFWGDVRYPYIFFFDTISLTLTWPDFRSMVVDELDYKSKPMGQVHKLKRERFAQSRFEAPEAFVRYLLTTYAVRSSPGVSDIDDEEYKDANELIQEDIAANEQVIEQLSLDPSPKLTSSDATQTTLVARKVRQAAFRHQVRTAYNNRCAVCGSSLVSRTSQLEVQAAHLFPKHLNGSDDIRNGVCLCRLHHWALDAGWIAIADDYTILVHGDLPATAEYEFIRRYKGQKLRLPDDRQLAPHPVFLCAHRKNLGF